MQKKLTGRTIVSAEHYTDECEDSGYLILKLDDGSTLYADSPTYYGTDGVERQHNDDGVKDPSPATSDAWYEYHYNGGPCPLDGPRDDRIGDDGSNICNP